MRLDRQAQDSKGGVTNYVTPSTEPDRQQAGGKTEQPAGVNAQRPIRLKEWCDQLCNPFH